MARHPLGGLGLLIVRDFAITHSFDTPHSVGLLWTSDQPVEETSTWPQTTHTRDKYPCPGWIRTHNPSKRAAIDPRLRPRGHCDRHAKRSSYLKLHWADCGYLSRWKSLYSHFNKMTLSYGQTRRRMVSDFSKDRSAFVFMFSLLGLLDPEDKCITSLQNTGIYLPNDTAWDPKILKSQYVSHLEILLEVCITAIWRVFSHTLSTATRTNDYRNHSLALHLLTCSSSDAVV
jgi:hypothetical protein